MTSTETVAMLQHRIARLEAERDIQRLMVKYAESLDYGDNQAWGECFIADGLFDVRRRGEAMFAHTGTEALVAFAGTHSSAPTTYHKHFMSVPAIDFHSEGASAKTYFTMLHESDNGPIVLVFGRYLDEIRQVEGQWRFCTRIVDMEALPSAAR